MARIAIIRQQYRPDGGAEKFVSSMLTAFDGSNHDLTVITRRWPGHGSTHRVITCKTPSFPRTRKNKNFNRQVTDVLQRENFDIVQSNERIPGCDIFRAGDGIHASWLTQRFRTFSKARRTYVRLNSFHRYMVSSERKMFEDPRLRIVICNSKVIRDEISAQFNIDPQRLKVVYNCVDLNRFAPRHTKQRDQLRQSLGIMPDDTAFVFVGSGFERKGVARAIQVIADCQSHLIVVGRDKASKRYQALAARCGVSERVHFVGMQSDTQPWYSAADGLLLLTLYDPFPNVVLEAMACGLPVVTTTKCGGADIIRDGEHGYICDSLDHDAAVHGVRQLEDETHRRSCGKNARLAVESFTEERMRNQLSAIYRQLLGSKVSRAA